MQLLTFTARPEGYVVDAEGNVEISSSDSVFGDYHIGVPENEANQKDTHVYPNPTNGLVTVTGKDLKQAKVLNNVGQRVATATGKGKTLHIDIANLPEGVYFVSFTDVNGSKFVCKVLKE